MTLALSKQTLQTLIKMQCPDWQGRLFYFEQIDSTNQFLLDKSQSRLPLASIAFANVQTAGRGQHGRPWLTLSHHNLTFSIAYRFKSLIQVQGLSLTVGVILAQVLKELGAQNLGLKWPNDLYYDGRKLAGILCENKVHAKGQVYTVIGIGLNCYLPEELRAQIGQPVADLIDVLRSPIDRYSLFIDLAASLIKRLKVFTQAGFQAFKQEYSELDVLTTREVEREYLKKTHKALALGVNDQGAMLIKQDGNIIEILDNSPNSIKLIPKT